MSGARFTDWTHTRVVGDRDAAARYVPEARKLLGFVMDEAKHNNLGVHQITRKLADGTVIIAEKYGSIPRITIIPVSSKGKKQKRTTTGFHLSWAGNAPERTPILFNEPSGEEGSDEYRDWSVSFFNSEAYGYGLVPEERLGGSYIDVFGVKAGQQGYRLLPANGMWYDPEEEEVVGWFRGYNSYWPHHYRHPATNYANFVSIYGHIVYVVPNTAWRVLAAAKREGWLYVLIAEDLGAMSPSMPPAAPTYSGQVWCSQPYDDSARTYSLWRYPLTVVTEPDTGVETYRAAPHDDAQMLWSGSLELAYGAWSFNRDCSRCVTVQLPRVATWGQVYEVVGPNWVPSSTEFSSYPAEATERIEVTITHGDGEPTASVSSAPAYGLIAEDDDVVLTLVEVSGGAVTATEGRVEYRCGDFALPIIDWVRTGSVQWFERRAMIHAHLPTRTFLFHWWRTDVLPSRHVSAGFELYVDGVLTDLDDPSAEDTAFSADFFDAAIASNFNLHMGMGYDNGLGTSWWRRFDAMTFLLGFTFATQGAAPTATGGAPGFGYQGSPLVAFAYHHTNYVEHTAAGGYLYGSAGGAPGTQYWDNFPYAQMYGANHGSYLDDEPIAGGALSHFGGIATHEKNTLAVTGLQPLIAVDAGGGGGGLFSLLSQDRLIYFGTQGDATSLLDPIYAPGIWTGGTIGHTGKPRKNQRGTF